MSLARLPYRARQFWLALFARPGTAGLQNARAILGLSLWELFNTLQPGEQVHSLNVLFQLQARGETDPDLLVAALLHDAGKMQRPLRLWERAWIVLSKRFFSDMPDRWAHLSPEQVGSLPFWQQPLAVAACHPAWGAQLAAQRGASELAAALIAAHQDAQPFPAHTHAARLLAALQSVDDQN